MYKSCWLRGRGDCPDWSLNRVLGRLSGGMLGEALVQGGECPNFGICVYRWCPMQNAMYTAAVLYVCLSVTFVHCVQTPEHIKQSWLSEHRQALMVITLSHVMLQQLDHPFRCKFYCSCNANCVLHLVTCCLQVVFYHNQSRSTIIITII